MKKDRKLIQSIVRATSILDLFIEEKRPLGITDFSRRLGLPKTTIAGIVSTLLSAGYLEKNPLSIKYRLGPKLFLLGMKCSTNTDLITICRAWLDKLCFQFSEPINLGTLTASKIVLVTRIEPGNRYMVFPQTGLTIPLHSSCIGKVLLAHLDSAERDAMLAGYHFHQYTKNSITSREHFLEELDEVKASGFATDNQENLIGIAGIGGPIINHTGKAIAAFAVSGDSDTINKRRREIIEAVRFTSQQIAAQLGFTG